MGLLQCMNLVSCRCHCTRIAVREQNGSWCQSSVSDRISRTAASRKELKTFRKSWIGKDRPLATALWLYKRMITAEKVIVIDVDGTLADRCGSGQSYAEVSAVPNVVQKTRSLKGQGYWIILYTSRNMRTYDGNIGRIMRHTAPVLVEWLARNEIPYDELHFGKPLVWS
jgi:capsule biosynthesis phosphatase